MVKVKFYENIADKLLSFAVIFAKTQNKYVFCKHRDSSVRSAARMLQ